MKTWKNAIRKIALSILVAVMCAATVICSAGSMNYSSEVSQQLYMIAGVLNLVFGFGGLYFLIQEAQRKDVIDPSE